MSLLSQLQGASSLKAAKLPGPPLIRDKLPETAPIPAAQAATRGLQPIVERPRLHGGVAHAKPEVAIIACRLPVLIRFDKIRKSESANALPDLSIVRVNGSLSTFTL